MLRPFPFLILLVLLLIFPSEPVSATVTPSFVAVSAIAASTGADVTLTLPATWEPGDIFLVIGVVKDQDDSVTMTGYTPMTGTPFNRAAASRYWLFWKRATTSESNPIFDKSGATGSTSALLAVYRNAITSGTPFDVIGSPASGTSDPALCTAITTVNEYILTITALAGENTNNAAITTTATNPRAAWVEHYAESATSASMNTFSEFQKVETGTTGTVSVNFDVANPTGWGCMVLSLAGPSGSSAFNSLVKTTAEAPGANCANGGIKVESGLDNGDGGGTANDGILQAGEVDATSYVCNGSPGAPGTNGTDGYNSLVSVDTLVGTNCDAFSGTGQRIRWGLDNGDGGGTARDGILQAGEVDGTSYVCDGAEGAQGAQGPQGPPGMNGTNGTDGINGTNGTDGADGTNGTDGADGLPGADGVFWVISDIVTLLLIAYVLLLVLAYSSELPFIYLLAGMIALLMAVQAYNETSSSLVGIALGALGLVTLLGGLNDIVSSRRSES